MPLHRLTTKLLPRPAATATERWIICVVIVLTLLTAGGSVAILSLVVELSDVTQQARNDRIASQSAQDASIKRNQDLIEKNKRARILDQQRTDREVLAILTCAEHNKTLPAIQACLQSYIKSHGVGDSAKKQPYTKVAPSYTPQPSAPVSHVPGAAGAPQRSSAVPQVRQTGHGNSHAASTPTTVTPGRPTRSPGSAPAPTPALLPSNVCLPGAICIGI